ncbi:MAG: ABC transporter permease [Pseudomonadota bacterium]
MIVDRLSLAAKSLSVRKLPVLLSLLAIALSVGLIVVTEKVRSGVREGFENTITSTDLVVGARTGPLSVVLYSIFRLGDPLQSVSWETYQLVDNHRDVAWTVPLSLGDSHRGYRVLGTDERYLQHYRYGDEQSLSFAQGGWTKDLKDTVIGAEVARSLGYKVGDTIVLSHGIVSVGFADHTDDPFTVVGIFAPTGTPVDRTVHVSLRGLEAIHTTSEQVDSIQPKAVTAFLVGMKSRPLVLRFQRLLNTYSDEPLTAVIPGVALSRLWSVIAPIENLLRGITFLVFAIGMIGLSTTLLSSLAGRKRELAVLRAVGAKPRDLLTVLMVEAIITSLGGVILGLLFAYLSLLTLGPWLRSSFGLVIEATAPGQFDAMVVLAVLAVGMIAGLVPGIAAYRQGLNESLSSDA